MRGHTSGKNGGAMGDTVLIADSNADRAARLADVCEQRGIDVLEASHGALALELALGQSPVAMVAQLGLPLIDGARLSEILRTNPRTANMGILFIGDDHVAPPEGEAANRVIPGHADPETTVHFIEALLQKRRIPTGEAPEPAGGIEGEIAQVSLPELIELFHVNRKTGSIEVDRRVGRRRERGRVQLRDGDVVHAESGMIQGEKALYRLFAWDRGHFSFRPQQQGEEATIDRPTRALLREGQRQATEWDRLVVDLPPDHARVTLRVSRDALPSVLHPLTQEVLIVLDLTDRVDQILDRCSFPDYQVLRTLATMLRRGLVELRREAPAGPVGPLSAPTAARLRNRLEIGPGVKIAEGKVLVIAAGDEATREFASLLGRVPGAELTFGDGPIDRALAFCRLEIDEEVTVQWLAVPASRRFEATWALAAYGAIGVVFVHGGPLDASVAALRPAIQQITAQPRSRTFHVVLGDKDVRESAASLCEGLELFDDRNVVAIAMDDPDPAEAAMTDLLTRLLG